MFRHNVRALNWLSSCLRSLLTFLSWFRKYYKVKHHYKKINFAFQWKTLYFEEPWKRPRFVFVFLSGEMKQFSLLRNYWDLLSIYRNLIHTTGSTCFETNGCLFQRYERWWKFCETNKKNFHAISLPVWTTTTRKGIVQK